MTPADRFREELRLELATTRDLDIRRIFLAAIERGPGTDAWSEAVVILGLRQLGRDVQPPIGWEARVMASIRARRSARLRTTLIRIWHRVWPFLVGIPAGVTVGILIGCAIARWL